MSTLKVNAIKNLNSEAQFGPVLGTPQNASGVAVDFLGIPSWAKKITVLFSGISTNGTSNLQIQVGTAAGFYTTGYVGTISNQAGTSANNSAGFQVANTLLATDVMWGTAEIIKTDINPTQVVCTSMLANSAAANTRYGAGAATPPNVIDRIRITTVGGVDVFDAGQFNIMYE